jgi:hypothetical protein
LARLNPLCRGSDGSGSTARSFCIGHGAKSRLCHPSKTSHLAGFELASWMLRFLRGGARAPHVCHPKLSVETPRLSSRPQTSSPPRYSLFRKPTSDHTQLYSPCPLPTTTLCLLTHHHQFVCRSIHLHNDTFAQRARVAS